MKRKEFDKEWKTNPFTICGIKYYVEETPELVTYCKTITTIIRKLSKKILTDLKHLPDDQLTKQLVGPFATTTLARNIAKNNLYWMKEFGINTQSNGALITHIVSQPYCAYFQRNKKLPNLPIQFRDTCSIFWKDGGITNGQPYSLTIKKPTLNDQTITVPYQLKLHDIPNAEFTELSLTGESGGNLIRKENQQWHFVLQGCKPFKWSYEPQKFLGIDVGKQKDCFIYMSNGKHWECPDSVIHYQDIIRKLNKQIKDSFFNNTIKSKQRNRLHIKRKKLHRKHSKALIKQTTIIDDIIAITKQEQALLCLDKLTSGTKNGTFGQDKLLPELHKRCVHEGIPFVSVPTPYTSQRCNICGYTSPVNLDNKTFICHKCTNVDHRDTNAAKNIAEFGFYIWNYGKPKFKKLTDQIRIEQKKNLTEKGIKEAIFNLQV